MEQTELNLTPTIELYVTRNGVTEKVADVTIDECFGAVERINKLTEDK